MESLSLNDARYVEAAEGWLGLGNHLEANNELEHITPQMRAHPNVLQVRWQVFAKEKKWEAALEIAVAISKTAPDLAFGWTHTAYSLHELKRTQEARNLLLPVAGRFPDEWIIRYNLACYACQLGQSGDAFHWLFKAIEQAGIKTIRPMALSDHDLEPLWGEIARLYPANAPWVR